MIVRSTHRGLRYSDGRMVDMREREITIKGQEILTADKVALRVSVITQFRVTDPVAAVESVADYENRLCSDVQLAARRSLATMPLAEILTNRNQLSEDILRDVTAAAAGYGVAISRADVKDLVFPGNLQEIMNRVLATERLSEAALVESRTKAEQGRIEAAARAENEQLEARARREAALLTAQADAEAMRERAAADVGALRHRARCERRRAALHRLRQGHRPHDLAVLIGDVG